MAATIASLPSQVGLNQGGDDPPLLEFEWEIPLALLPQGLWQVAVDLANARLETIYSDLLAFTPVDTGALRDSLAVKRASVFDPSIGAVYAEVERRHGWYVNYGWFRPSDGASFTGYRWFDSIVLAHLTRLEQDVFELAAFAPLDLGGRPELPLDFFGA